MTRHSTPTSRLTAIAAAAFVVAAPVDSLRAQRSASLRAEVLIDSAANHDFPTLIAVCGDLLIVGGGRSDTAFLVHDRATGRRLSAFGREGSGPLEFRQPSSLQAQHTCNGNEGEVAIFDPANGRLSVVRVRGNQRPSLLRAAVGELAGQSAVMVGYDGHLYGFGAFAEARISEFDPDGKRRRAFGENPLVEDGVPPSVANQALQPSVAVTAGGRVAFVGARYAGRIDVYSLSDGRRTEARVPRPFAPRIDVAHNGAMLVFRTNQDTRFGYIAVAASRDLVFALFSGRTRSTAPGRANYGNEVHVFDTAGRLKQRLRLDRDVFDLAPTPDGRTLFAIAHDPAPQTLRFAIPPSR